MVRVGRCVHLGPRMRDPPSSLLSCRVRLSAKGRLNPPVIEEAEVCGDK